MTFKNESENPAECAFLFDQDPDIIVGGLKAIIDGKEIQAQVLELEMAEEKYDDQVAKGNVAIIGKKQHQYGRDYLQIVLGNLLPQSTCELSVQLYTNLKIEGDSYAVKIPAAFFPNY